jgi:hypothetical protein
MNHTVSVSLQWLVPNSERPRGPEFTIPARFDLQGENWTEDAWSLTVTVSGPADARDRQLATARFLVSDAPHLWLSEGRRFTLFTSRPLAEGIVEEIPKDSATPERS